MTDGDLLQAYLPLTPDSLVVGVVGAGAMGAGIAQVAASHGHRVLLADASRAAIERAQAGHANALARDVEKGRRTREEADAVLARLTYIDGVDEARLAAFAECGFVIEAIVEQLPAKQALFRTLDAIVSERATLASNTSSLSIAAIAGACTRSDRVIGVHFFNPAPVLPLVEIIRAVSSSPLHARWATAVVESWGKTTVRAPDTPGFLVNRIARPFYGESLVICDEGLADYATVDWALTTIGGFRMGPFTLMDLIGLDVNFAVSCSVYEGTFHDPRYRPSVTQQRLVEAGWLGRKSGRGYYRYDDGRSGFDPAAAMQQPALGQQIVDRVLAMLVNEAAAAFDNRLALNADIETAMTKGVNYPRGLLAWGDAIGPAKILAEMERLQHTYGDARYRPARRLRDVATRGGRLVDQGYTVTAG